MRKLCGMTLDTGNHLKAYTKLVEDFQTNNLTMNFDGGTITRIYAMEESHGCDIVFAGTDAKLACYCFGCGLSAPFGSSVVPLPGTGITAAIGGDNCIYVFAFHEGQVYFSKESAPASRRFQPAKTFGLPFPENMSEILGLIVKQFDHGFVLGAISKTLDSKVHYFSYQGFDVEIPPQILDVPFQTMHLVLEGDSPDSLSVIALGDRYVECHLTSKELHSFALTNTAGAKVGTPCHLHSANGQIFIATKEGRYYYLYAVSVNEAKKKAIAFQLAELQSYASFQVEYHKETLTYHFFLDASQLMHMEAVSTQSSGFQISYPCAIEKDHQAYFLCRSHGHISVYYEEDQSFIRLDRNTSTGDWTETIITGLNQGGTTSQSCYSTEITLLGTHKEPLVNEEVQVWTEERTYLIVGGKQYFTDKDHPISLTTDMEGRITVLQYVNGLNSNPILASSPLIAHNEVLVVKQHEHVQAHMSSVNADELYDSKHSIRDSCGTYHDEYVLKGDYRSEGNAKALAESIKKITSLASPVNSNPYAFGTYICKKNELAGLNQIVPRDNLPSWALRVKDGHIHFEELKGEDIAVRIQSLKYSSEGVALPKWLVSIGDFFRSIAKKIVSVVEMIVNGIKAVVKIVLNGIEMIFEAIISCISQVFNCIMTIFIAVAVFFVVVFAWLIFQSKWDDILLTKVAVKKLLSSFLDRLPGEILRMKQCVHGGIEDLRKELKDLSDKMVAQVAPDGSVFNYIEENNKPDPQMEQDLSNNMVLEKLKDSLNDRNIGISPLQMSLHLNELDGILDDILSYEDYISQSNAFAEAKSYIDSSVSQYDDLFQCLFATMIKVIEGLMDLILSTVGELIDKLFDAVTDLCNWIKKVMEEEIHIPLVSQVYEFIASGPLSIIDLISLLISIPVTLLCKTKDGKAPFESNGEIDRFVQDVSAIPLLPDQLSTLSSQKDTTYNLSKQDRKILLLTGGVTGVLFCVLTGIMDFSNALTEKDEKKDPWDAILGGICWGLELVWTALACPAFFAAGKASFPSYYLFAITCFGLFLDLYILVTTGTYIDQVKELRKATMLYGFTHLCGVILYCFAAEIAPWYDITQNFTCVAMEIFKPMLNLESKPLRMVAPFLNSGSAVTVAIYTGCSVKDLRDAPLRLASDSKGGLCDE